MAARADDDQAGAVEFGPDYGSGYRRQPSRQVDRVHQDDFAVGQFFDRVGRGRGPQHVEKDFDGVIAIHAGAVVDVVGADYGAGKLLQQVALFVRAAGRIQKSDGIGPMAVADLLQAGGDEIRMPRPTILRETGRCV